MSSTSLSASDVDASQDNDQKVVIDAGTGQMKVGFGGDDTPRACFPTLVGIPRTDATSLITGSGSGKDKYFVGKQALENSAVLECKNPISDGIVTWMEGLYFLFEHTFTTELRVNPKTVKCLITEAANNPDENRFELFKMVFNQCQVQAAQVQVQAVLALYASGRTTGLVYDSGDGVSHTVPVFKGYGLKTAVVATKCAGRTVTKRVLWALNKYHKLDFENENNGQEIARALKENICQFEVNIEEEIEKVVSGQTEGKEYEFKDGSTIIAKELIYAPPGVLSNPKAHGMRVKSVAEVLKDTIDKTNIEMRTSMYENTVLSGGTTCIQNYHPTFVHYFKSVVTDNAKDRIKVSSPNDRQYVVFIGGSILSSLGSFEQSWIGKAEYEECGNEVIQRKRLF